MSEADLLALQPIEADEANHIGHYVYCHHCRRMGTLKLLGRDSFGKLIFECCQRMHDPRGFVLEEVCGGLVPVVLAVAAS